MIDHDAEELVDCSFVLLLFCLCYRFHLDLLESGLLMVRGRHIPAKTLLKSKNGTDYK